MLTAFEGKVIETHGSHYWIQDRIARKTTEKSRSQTRATMITDENASITIDYNLSFVSH